VILEACHSAGASPGLARGAVEPLINAGVDSVIGMAHAVSVAATQVFFQSFYQYIVAGECVARATWRARVALADCVEELAIRHAWPVFVLTQCGPERALVEPSDAAAPIPVMGLAELPALPHAFVGRWRTRLQIDEALDARRSTVIVGPGGQGKTALAIEVARWRTRIGAVDRIVFVNLEQIFEARGLLAMIGRRVVGPRFTVGDLDETLEAVVDATASRATLVLFDNCESAITPDAGAPIRKAWRRSPALLQTMCALIRRLTGQAEVLLTSRIALPDVDLQRVRLRGLASDEGTALIGAACVAAGIEPQPAERSELMALVRAVHGHPRSLVRLPTLFGEQPIAQATERIATLLQVLESRSPGHRERSLLASARLSLERLPAAMWPQLGPLAVFEQGVVLWVASVMLELGEDDFEALLAGLEAVELLEREVDGAWLRFHPALTTLIGIEPGCRADRVNTERRDEIYLATVEHLYANLNGPKRGFTSRLARAEWPNLLAALRSLSMRAGEDPRQLEVALGYATELEGILRHTGMQTACVRVGETRDELFSRLESMGVWGRALINARYTRIEALLAEGRKVEAWQASQAIVARCEAVDEPDAAATYDHALVLWQHARAAREMGRADLGLTAVERAWRLFASVREAPGAVRMSGLCMAERAQLYRALGRYDTAVSEYTRAARHAEQMNDRRAQAVALHNRAEAQLQRRDFDSALRDFADCRAMYATLDEPAAARSVLAGIGLVHERRGDLNAAERAFSEALAQEQAAGDRSSAAETMRQLGVLAAQHGRMEDAISWDRRALAAHQALGDRRAEGMSWHNLGRHLAAAERLDEARDALRTAASVLGALGISAHPWRPWDSLAELALQRGEIDEAAAFQARDTYGAWRAQGGARVLAPEELRLLDEAEHGLVTTDDERYQALEDALNALHSGTSSHERYAKLTPLQRYEVERLAERGLPTRSPDSVRETP
jgi:tetratricopeptide (TPR) repeat protein